MASIIRNVRRGTWQVQWHNGKAWVRKTVIGKKRGWKVGDPMPTKPPGQAIEALVIFSKQEDSFRSCRAEPEAASEKIEEFLADYLVWYGARRQASSHRNAGIAVATFLAFCKQSRLSRVDQITPAILDRHLSERAATAKQSTLSTYRASLAAAWSRAVKLKLVRENPWVGLDIPGDKSKVKRTSWTRVEFELLWRASKSHWRNLLTLGVNTGLRINALVNLEWRDIEWGKGGFGEVVVRPELDKIGRGYRVPMSEACHDLLCRLLAERTKAHEFVLVDRNGDRVKRDVVGEAILSAAKKAKLPKPISPCHAMRRTFGRWAVLGDLTGRPIPLYVVSKWMGHTSVQMTQHYLDLNEQASQQWMTQVTPEESASA